MPEVTLWSSELLLAGLFWFWSLWFLVVAIMNIADLLVDLQVLRPGFPLASGNLRMIREVTARYHPPAWLTRLLFVGVIALQIGATWTYAGAGLAPRSIYPFLALALAGILLGGFLLADEILGVYTYAAQLQAGHRALLGLQILTLIVLLV